MADNNPFAQYLGLGQAQGMQDQQGMAGMQQNMMAQQYLMARQNQLAFFAGDGNAQWWGGDPARFEVESGEGNAFVARFTCATTGECFELTSLERPAVERGMRHLIGKWDRAVRNLLDAGLEACELAPSLAILRPRILADAQRERDLEEGLRQAESKAKSLLALCLTPEQQVELKESERFTINVDHRVSGFPTGAFRIKKGSAFNVEHIESGETFCVVAQEKVPVWDQMLTQKLLLEQEPERFFKTANRSGRSHADNMNTLLRVMYERHFRDMNNRFVAAVPPVAPLPAPVEDDNPLRQAVREFTARHR